MKRNALFVAVAAMATSNLVAAQQDDNWTPGPLEHVLVTMPLHKQATQTTLSFNVLSGDELAREVQLTLGDTIANQPGMFNASYGPGVGQPVIRGQSGPRITVLQNGTTSADVAIFSQDHAVAVEPLLASSIEVLRGPATLFYGGGAIGGVVNVIDNRIPRQAIDAPNASLGYRYDGASRANVAAGVVEGAVGGLSLHLDGMMRTTDDLQVADGAGTEGGDVLLNTDTEAKSFTLGGAWHFEDGYFGLAVSHMTNRYGLPAGTHDHDHDHGGDHDDHDDHDEHDHGGEVDGDGIRLNLEQTRYDARLELNEPLPGLQTLRGFLTHTEYEHDEVEPGNFVGVTFDNQTTEARLEAVHNTLGSIDGAFGMQYSDAQFSALGAEAYVPPTDIERMGIFLTEEWQRDSLAVEFGARFDSDDYAPVGNAGPSRSFDAFSASVGARYALIDDLSLSVNLGRFERAPSVSALYSNVTNLESEDYVEHFAIGAIPLGDVDLDTERAINIEAGFSWSNGEHQLSVTGFVYDYDNYIYAMNTGRFGEGHGHGHDDDHMDDHDDDHDDDHMDEHDDDHDHDDDHHDDHDDDHHDDHDDDHGAEEGAPILQWSQEAALFYGVEVDADWQLFSADAGRLLLETGIDYVRADLDRGGDVPRMPPFRGRLGLSWSQENAYYFTRLIAVDEQRHPGRFEEETRSWVRWDIGANWTIPTQSGDIELNAGVRNITNEEIRLSTSFLREDAPEPGRSLQLGIRWAL